MLRLSSIEDGMNVALAIQSSAESEEMAHSKVVLSLMALQDSLEEIIEKESFASLSIRKLARDVGYSPANIYQYYESKAEIVRAVVQKGYSEIINSIKTEKSDFKNVEQEIRFRFKKYINSALKNKDYYRAVMLSQESEILSMTSILNPELREKPSAIEFLVNLIEKGQKQGEFAQGDAKTRTKIIWTATFGLIIRLIIEEIDNEKVKNQLIESHFETIFAGIRNK